MSFANDRLLDGSVFVVQKLAVGDRSDEHAAADGEIAKADICLVQRRIGRLEKLRESGRDAGVDRVEHPIIKQQRNHVEVGEQDEWVPKRFGRRPRVAVDERSSDYRNEGTPKGRWPYTSVAHNRP